LLFAAAAENTPLRALEAVSALQSAAKSISRDGDPFSWGLAHQGLGLAYSALSFQDEQGAGGRLTEAVDAYDAALQVETSECTPLLWARTQVQLGQVLERRGELEKSETSFAHSETAYHEALKVFTLGRVPDLWASTQMSLGEALRTHGETERRDDLVCQALYRHLLVREILSLELTLRLQALQQTWFDVDVLRRLFGDPAVKRCLMKVNLALGAAIDLGLLPKPPASVPGHRTRSRPHG